MGLDVRLPLGLLFIVIGAILASYGLFTNGSTEYAKSMGVNLNLIWGAILMLLGLVGAWFGQKTK